MIGAAASYPFAILVGKRMMRFQGGVPVFPNQRWIEDWPNVRANRTTNRFFRRYTVLTCLVGGFVLGRVMADDSILNNEYYTRPDLKPFPAMVKDPIGYDKDVYQQLLQKNYNNRKDDSLV